MVNKNGLIFSWLRASSGFEFRAWVGLGLVMTNLSGSEAYCIKIIFEKFQTSCLVGLGTGFRWISVVWAHQCARTNGFGPCPDPVLVTREILNKHNLRLSSIAPGRFIVRVPRSIWKPKWKVTNAFEKIFFSENDQFMTGDVLKPRSIQTRLPSFDLIFKRTDFCQKWPKKKENKTGWRIFKWGKIFSRG